MSGFQAPASDRSLVELLRNLLVAGTERLDIARHSPIVDHSFLDRLGPRCQPGVSGQAGAMGVITKRSTRAELGRSATGETGSGVRNDAAANGCPTYPAVWGATDMADPVPDPRRAGEEPEPERLAPEVPPP